MIAYRYSGKVKIRITLTDDDIYICHVSAKGEAPYRSQVLPPLFRATPLDSSEAYDDTASAVLSFALDDRAQVAELAEQDWHGWIIRRRK